MGKGEQIIHTLQKLDLSKLLQQETAFHTQVHQGSLLSPFHPACHVYTNPR